MRRKAAGFSVFQRGDGRWVLAYQDEPGRWRQRVLESDNERAANREAHRWLAERAAQGRTSGKTIRDLWRDWLKMRAASPNLATSTVRDNESHFERDLLPRIGDVGIGDLTHIHVRDLVVDLTPGRSASKVRNVVSTLSAFYEDARAEGWVTSQTNVVRHPAVAKVLPSATTTDEPVYLEREVAQSLCDASSTPEHRRARYVVALLTGMRDGEVQGLKWGDVHLDTEVPYVRVERQFAMKASPDAYAALTDTKTEKSVRSIPLHDAARDALRWWRAVGWSFFVGREPTPGDAVFASINGAHWRPKSARELRSDLERAGLATTSPKGDPIDFHAARRSFATWLADAGVDDRAIGTMMGHVGATVTTRHYTAAALRRLADAVALVPFRWQDPRGFGAREGGQGPHSAEVVRPHSETAQEVPQASDIKEQAPVAQWIEQRFPKSTAGRAKTKKSALAHNAAGVSGATGDGRSPDVAWYEARASAFDGRRVERRRLKVSRRGERDAEVSRLLTEGVRVAMGDTSVPETARPGHVRDLLRRADELLRGR